MKNKPLIWAALGAALTLLIVNFATPAIALEGVPFFDNLGNKNSGTCTGNTSTKINTITTAFQKGITITNTDETSGLYIECVRKGAPAPTITQANHFIFIPATEFQHIDCGAGLDWYGMNSSGDGTTSTFRVTAWK